MILLRRLAAFWLLVTASTLLWCQTPSNPPDVSPASPGGIPASALLPEPPVPTDPLEMVTGSADSVQTVDQRAAVVNLLTRAFVLSNVRAYPYERKWTFNSFELNLFRRQLAVTGYGDRN